MAFGRAVIECGTIGRAVVLTTDTIDRVLDARVAGTWIDSILRTIAFNFSIKKIDSRLFYKQLYFIIIHTLKLLNVRLNRT